MSDNYEEIMDISKRRGFIWPSFEIHGGASGFYDYGPLGSNLLDNIEKNWKRHYKEIEGFSEITTTNIMSESVFEASGHLSGFEDSLTKCKECNKSFRADHLIEDFVEVEPDTLSNKKIEEKIKENNVTCPECNGGLGEVYDFNLMFETNIGPGKGRPAYLRPETAQGIFVNFNYLYQFNRKKIPFGVIQTGRAYRNEISPRKGVVRMREFQQMEAEVFVEPEKKTHSSFSDVSDQKLTLYPINHQKNNKDYLECPAKEAVENGIVDSELLAYYLVLSKEFLLNIGLDVEKLRFRQHLPEERAHYASDCWDVEARSERFGWIELAGISDREDYDLKKHSEESNKDLRAFKKYEEPIKKTKHVIEPNMDLIGPKYKEDAKKVVEKLKSRNPVKLEESLEDGEVEIEVGEEKFVVNDDMVDITKKEEIVKGEKYFPHVIEPSYGLDRITYVLMEHSFEKDIVDDEERTYFGFSPKISPIKVAVFPLTKEEDLVKKAREVYDSIKNDFEAIYDDSGSIGRRYRRQDEIGTPYCITIDHETLENETVTVRDRDTTKQVRFSINKIIRDLNKFVSGEEDIFDSHEVS